VAAKEAVPNAGHNALVSAKPDPLTFSTERS